MQSASSEMCFKVLECQDVAAQTAMNRMFETEDQIRAAAICIIRSSSLNSCHSLRDLAAFHLPLGNSPNLACLAQWETDKAFLPCGWPPRSSGLRRAIRPYRSPSNRPRPPEASNRETPLAIPSCSRKRLRARQIVFPWFPQTQTPARSWRRLSSGRRSRYCRGPHVRTGRDQSRQPDRQLKEALPGRPSGADHSKADCCVGQPAGGSAASRSASCQRSMPSCFSIADVL